VTEAKVMARRAHIRNATIATIYEECAAGIGYNQKNSYLEDRIEATNSYFNHLDDLNNKGADMEKVKKQLFKLNRELRRREAEGLERLDPAEFLDNMIKEEEARNAKAAKGPNSVDDSDIASPLSVEAPSPLKTAQPTAAQLEEKIE
jgi:inactivated superfamily I helicase